MLAGVAFLARTTAASIPFAVTAVALEILIFGRCGQQSLLQRQSLSVRNQRCGCSRWQELLSDCDDRRVMVSVTVRPAARRWWRWCGSTSLSTTRAASRRAGWGTTSWSSRTARRRRRRSCRSCMLSAPLIYYHCLTISFAGRAGVPPRRRRRARRAGGALQGGAGADGHAHRALHDAVLRLRRAGGDRVAAHHAAGVRTQPTREVMFKF